MSDEKSSWFIYGFVARGTVVLAEYTEYTGNFAAIAARCLDKLPSSNNRFTYACDGHTFNFLVNDGYGLMCLMTRVKMHAEAGVFGGFCTGTQACWGLVPTQVVAKDTG